MFQESPLSGVCAYSVLEVILMLVGTLLLGLLLGYLIWGWTRRKLKETEKQLTSLSAANESLNQQLAALASTSRDQERELDVLNTRNSSQRQQMASLTVANNNLKKQLDEVGVGAGCDASPAIAAHVGSKLSPASAFVGTGPRNVLSGI